MFKYWVYKFGQFWVTHLPLAVSYRLAVYISALHYLFSFRDRRAVRANLRLIIGEADDLEARVNEVFCNFGRYLVDFFRMAKDVDREFIDRKIRIENLDRVAEALKKDRGGIILTAHIGNWELGGVILSRLGYSSLAIALPHRERPVNNLFNQQREQQGIRVVPLQLSIRKCLETLEQNKLIAVLADRNFTPHGEVLDFLGRQAMFPKGPALFALRTGAPIIPTFLVREGEDRFSLSVEEPIHPDGLPHGDTEHQKILALMKQYVAVIERKIRQYPTQWLMFREFWVK